MFNWKVVLGIAGLGLGVGGCHSALTGNEGNLTFTYEADDDAHNFNKPIAVGAMVDIKVAEVGQERAVQVEHVESDDADVLAAEPPSQGNMFTVTGVGEGSALISVEGRTEGGELLPDSSNMLGAVPEVLKMSHACNSTDGEVGYYLAGTEGLLLPFDMEKENGQPVIGYGYHPITIEPADGLTLDTTTKDQDDFHVDASSNPQEVTISSTIDDSRLIARLIAESDIDGVSIEPTADEIELDSKGFAAVWPLVGDARVCMADVPAEPESTTPTVCTVNASTNRPWVQGSPVTSLSITPKKTGTCTFTVTLPGANGGAGVVAEQSLEVVVDTSD